VTSHAVFEAAIWVKSTHLINSCLNTRKKRKCRNKDIHKYSISVAYRNFCRSGRVIEVRSRSRILV